MPMNAHGAGFHSLHPPCLIATDDAYKRGSDSAIEAKLHEKLANKSTAEAHCVCLYAQSLDLTVLGMMSHGLGSRGFGRLIIDNGGAEGDGQDSLFESSPPVSAMMPTFPCLSDAPLGNLIALCLL